jgi:Spy/CpxP family protein refolding chaperone
MRVYTVALFAAAVLTASAARVVQQHVQNAGMSAMSCGGGMMGMMHEMPKGHDMMMKHGMMRGMMGPPSPAMILHHKENLSLSAEQVTKLESLQKQAEPACAQQLQAGMASYKAANEMLQADSPDFSAYSAKLKEACGQMMEARLTLAKASVAAREVLTPAQREKATGMMKEMHEKKK